MHVGKVCAQEGATRCDDRGTLCGVERAPERVGHRLHGHAVERASARDIGEGLVAPRLSEADERCASDELLDACGGVLGEHRVALTQQLLKVLHVHAVILPLQCVEGLRDELLCAVEWVLCDGDVGLQARARYKLDTSRSIQGWICATSCVQSVTMGRPAGTITGQSGLVRAREHYVMPQAPHARDALGKIASLGHQVGGVVPIVQEQVWCGQAERAFDLLACVQLRPVIIGDEAALHRPLSGLSDPRARDGAPCDIELVAVEQDGRSGQRDASFDDMSEQQKL